MAAWQRELASELAAATVNSLLVSLSGSAPSALHTSLALRQAIWRKTEPGWGLCGTPEVLYVDHGSDFTFRHLEHVSADLHIQLIHSTVGRSQGRGKIERFFRTVNQLLRTRSTYPAVVPRLGRGRRPTRSTPGHRVGRLPLWT